jgi:tetratricopeptide (TPR) repeat protein
MPLATQGTLWGARSTQAGVQPTALLREALDSQLRGRLHEAAEGFAAAIDQGLARGQRHIVAEALRRLAVVHQMRGEPEAAAEFAGRSLELARELAQDGLVAEALNALAGVEFESGEIEAARRHYHEALELGAASASLVARIEGNLGILANVQGELDQARTHYERALAAYETLGDERGCARVFHNLGMLCADRQRHREANHYFVRCLPMARAVGDAHLEASCLLNQCEVFLAHKRWNELMRNAQAALGIFERLDSRADKADAYRMLGIMLRETGQLSLAESRLRSAVETAAGAGALLGEAEACHELARLYQQTGRGADALQFVDRARRIFERLGARADITAVALLQAELAA